MSQSRREFMKTVGLAGAGCSLSTMVHGSELETRRPSDDRMGVLVDTTVCIGCRRCEKACKDAHGIPSGEAESYNDRNVFSKMRRPEVDALTVVNEFEDPKTSGKIDVKVQCMHCDYPACVSACIVGAFTKREDGSVLWDSSRCIGCRYCMVACPFQVPAFEYQKPIQPRVMKCDFCVDRTSKGEKPACVANCPVEALTYGRRYELVKMAKKQMIDHPDRYVDHLYGEREAGGTSWMYMASTEFKNLAFPMHSDRPAPGASEAVQHGIFKYFIPPISLFALLGGIMWLGHDDESKETGE